MHRRTFMGLTVTGLAAVAGCSGSTETADTGGGDGGADGGGEPASTPTPEPKTTHEMGEEFTVGSGEKSIQYRVADASTLERPIGTGSVSTEPDGIFVVVVLEMENVGQESLDISTRHLKLVDGQEREFEADTEALTYAGQDGGIQAEAITFDQLQPGLSVKRSVIYDVPSDQSYSLMAEPAGMFSGAEPHYVSLEL